MGNTVEIRWHGRGGQGAKTACLLLADAAFNSGKQVQGFPEYGPERMGAPITAYNRISEGGSGSSVHSNIYNPDFVVVVDETSGCYRRSFRKRRNHRQQQEEPCRSQKTAPRIQRQGLHSRRRVHLTGDPRQKYPEHADAGSSRRGKPCHRQRQISRRYGRLPSSQVRFQAAGRRRKHEGAENVYEAAEGRLRQQVKQAAQVKGKR